MNDSLLVFSKACEPYISVYPLINRQNIWSYQYSRKETCIGLSYHYRVLLPQYSQSFHNQSPADQVVIRSAASIHGIAHPATLTKGCYAPPTNWVEFNPLACKQFSVTPQALDGRTVAGDNDKRTAGWSLAPEDAESATVLGIAYMQGGDLERAVMLLRKALACESYYIPARYLLGVAYLVQGCYGEAVRAFEVVVALAPQHAHAVIGLGIAYSRAGQAERAHQAFAAVRQRWPDSPEVLLALACAYRAGGQPCAALDCLARVLAVAPADEAVVWRARRLLTAIEYEESTAHSRV